MSQIGLLFGMAIVSMLIVGGCGQLTVAPIPNIDWFEQTLDHFAFEPAPTWKQRYLWTDQFYDPSKPGVLLFYTGNEGDIYMFWNNTGFMFNLAIQLNGRILFAEHRYVCFFLFLFFFCFFSSSSLLSLLPYISDPLFLTIGAPLLTYPFCGHPSMENRCLSGKSLSCIHAI